MRSVRSTSCAIPTPGDHARAAARAPVLGTASAPEPEPMYDGTRVTRMIVYGEEAESQEEEESGAPRCVRLLRYCVI